MKRSIITESSFKLPEDGTSVLYSWYTAYSLWWEVGSGKRTPTYYNPDGWAIGTIVPDMLVRKVDELFESITYQLARKMVDVGGKLVHEEIENICDPSLVPADVLRYWLHNDALPSVRMSFHFDDNTGEYVMPSYHDFWSTCGWNGAVQLLSADLWQSWAETDAGWVPDGKPFYWGGSKWSDICRCFIDLISAIKHDNLHSVAYRIDRIYDVQHNTGSLFSKHCPLQVSKADLDNRAEIRDISGFIPHVPQQLVSLIMTCRRYLNGFGEGCAHQVIRKMVESKLTGKDVSKLLPQQIIDLLD